MPSCLLNFIPLPTLLLPFTANRPSCRKSNSSKMSLYMAILTFSFFSGKCIFLMAKSTPHKLYLSTIHLGRYSSMLISDDSNIFLIIPMTSLLPTPAVRLYTGTIIPVFLSILSYSISQLCSSVRGPRFFFTLPKALTMSPTLKVFLR